MEKWEVEMRRKLSILRKDKNKNNAIDILDALDIKYEKKKDGIHLIVSKGDSYIDYWPTTGLWICRKTKHSRRGIQTLLRYIKPNSVES